MRQAQTQQRFAPSQRARVDEHAIEWEELPSLANRVIHRPSAPGHGANDSRFQDSKSFDSPWSATMPVALEPAPCSQPFVERLSGLATREVTEPDLFQHFFGPNADAA